MKINKSFINKWIKIINFNTTDNHKKLKLENVGFAINQEIYVLNIINSQIVHLIIKGVEYAFRLKDLDFIEVDLVNE